MLVLTRKAGEVITIGDHIRIKVFSIQDGQVKVGIEAPADVKIFREEVYAQIQLQNLRATKATKQSVAKVATMFRKGSGRERSRRPAEE